MTKIIAEPIARTNGSCEGPCDEGTAEQVVAFKVGAYCGGEECEPFTEMIACLRLCPDCARRASEEETTLTLSTKDRARLTFAEKSGRSECPTCHKDTIVVEGRFSKHGKPTCSQSGQPAR